MTPSLDDFKAAVETARDGVRAAREAREAAIFDLDAAELDLLQAQGELRDADPIYSAVQEAAQVSDLDGNHQDREALCDAVDHFVNSLRLGGYDIVRKNA